MSKELPISISDPIVSGPIHFQCEYHWGPQVFEVPVCIEVTHSMRSGEWQHQGATCASCREYLRGQWRHCKHPLRVLTVTRLGHAS